MRSARRAGKCIYIMSCLLLLLPSVFVCVYVCVLSLVSWCQLVFDAIRLAGEWVYLYILICLLPGVFVCICVCGCVLTLVFDVFRLAGEWVNLYILGCLLLAPPKCFCVCFCLCLCLCLMRSAWRARSIYIGLPSPSSSWASWPAACLVPCATECHWSVRGKYCSEFRCKFILNFTSSFNYKPLRYCIYRGHTSGQS